MGSGRQRCHIGEIIPRRSLMDLPPLRDRIPPRPLILFVGINPGIRSALTGHHFAGYSNRFWTLLYEARLVPEPITCEDDDRLPEWGYGITNLVPRPTRGIDDLTNDDYAAGRRRLRRKIARVGPAVLALVGVTVYRHLFADTVRGRHRPGTGTVALGLQPDMLAGAPVFVLPNPSGRNANVTYAEMLAAFRALKQFAARAARSSPSRRRSRLPSHSAR